jgi:hypothetical protein
MISDSAAYRCSSCKSLELIDCFIHSKVLTGQEKGCDFMWTCGQPIIGDAIGQLKHSAALRQVKVFRARIRTIDGNNNFRVSDLQEFQDGYPRSRSRETDPIDDALGLLGSLGLRSFLSSHFLRRTSSRDIRLDPCKIAGTERVRREKRARMVRGRPFQLYQATLAGKRQVAVSCENREGKHVLPPSPMFTPTTPKPPRERPFCSRSLGPQFERRSELRSISAARSWDRSSLCRAKKLDRRVSELIQSIGTPTVFERVG